LPLCHNTCRASFACAAARSQELHGRDVEYITQSERSSRASFACASRIASRSAWPAPLAILPHAARPPADDLAVAHNDRAIGLIAGRNGLLAHAESRRDEVAMLRVRADRNEDGAGRADQDTTGAPAPHAGAPALTSL
jgi:hypothetical protein